jgi:hypothetical protein
VTLSSAFSIRVEKLRQGLGYAMSEIRSWLDTHKIEPADFRAHASVSGAVILEVTFKQEDEARLFERAFA